MGDGGGVVFQSGIKTRTARQLTMWVDEMRRCCLLCLPSERKDVTVSDKERQEAYQKLHRTCRVAMNAYIEFFMNDDIEVPRIHDAQFFREYLLPHSVIDMFFSIESLREMITDAQSLVRQCQISNLLKYAADEFRQKHGAPASFIQFCLKNLSEWAEDAKISVVNNNSNAQTNTNVKVDLQSRLTQCCDIMKASLVDKRRASAKDIRTIQDTTKLLDQSTQAATIKLKALKKIEDQKKSVESLGGGRMVRVSTVFDDEDPK